MSDIKKLLEDALRYMRWAFYYHPELYLSVSLGVIIMLLILFISSRGL